MEKIITLELLAAFKARMDNSIISKIIIEDLSKLKDRVLAIEIANGAGVTANPFAVTFENLIDISVEGVWNLENSRIEF